MVKATDNGQPAKYSLVRVLVILASHRKPLLFFPLQLYLGRIFENEPISNTSSILTIRALDIKTSKLGDTSAAKRYFLSSMDEDSFNFRLDDVTGNLYARRQFDYETRTSYTFGVYAYDINNRTASSQVQILIKGRESCNEIYLFSIFYILNVNKYEIVSMAKD